MEIPGNLKQLYRHWEDHVDLGMSKVAPESVFENKDLFEHVTWFINERLTIWEKKTVGKQPPYTDDPILSTYRFCNIFREFDKQTIEFHVLLNPLRDDFALWLLNMFYCRMVARTSTIKFAGLLSFDDQENKHMYERLMKSPRPRYGTPYVFPISVIQKSTTPTRELFIAHYLPTIMQCIAEEISTWKKMSVIEGLKKVILLFGYNLSFLWTEVLIDVAYQYPEYIDLFKEFPVGPGSLPTLKRINNNLESSQLASKLSQIDFDSGITYNGKPVRLSAENWEGVGCEYRKYTNLSQGLGRKRLYK